MTICSVPISDVAHLETLAMDAGTAFCASLKFSYKYGKYNQFKSEMIREEQDKSSDNRFVMVKYFSVN